MATYYFSGEARYPKLSEPVDKYNPAEGKEWTIDVKLDDASEALFTESGCQLRKSKDGEGFRTFRRPVSKMINEDLVEYDPPKVLDEKNDVLDPELVKALGNGSKVTIKVEIYGTRKGKGHTLEAVRVDEYVQYNATKAPDHVVTF
jgi:hypothetical protein